MVGWLVGRSSAPLSSSLNQLTRKASSFLVSSLQRTRDVDDRDPLLHCYNYSTQQSTAAVGSQHSAKHQQATEVQMETKNTRDDSREHFGHMSSVFLVIDEPVHLRKLRAVSSSYFPQIIASMFQWECFSNENIANFQNGNSQPPLGKGGQPRVDVADFILYVGNSSRSTPLRRSDEMGMRIKRRAGFDGTPRHPVIGLNHLSRRNRRTCREA